jgi:hypothetical protein
MTVAEMIAKLQTLPQGLEVNVTMNMEYSRVIDAEDFQVFTDKEGQCLLIGDVYN